MKNIYSIYEGILDKGNKDNVGKNLGDEMYGEMPKRQHGGETCYILSCQKGLEKNMDLLNKLYRCVPNPVAVKIKSSFDSYAGGYKIMIYIMDEKSFRSYYSNDRLLDGCSIYSTDSDEINAICYDIALRFRYNFDEMLKFCIEKDIKVGQMFKQRNSFEDIKGEQYDYDDIVKRFKRTR